ncbi:coiled-coil domain-containing protein 34 isoform 2-T2 [Polymixia lowei]
MSGREMPTSPASASKGFSSTPLKSLSTGKDLHRSGSVGEYVLSDDDTYSLLSPIYHHSFDSDEDPGSAARHPFQTDTSSRQSEDSRLSISPIRCELPKTHMEKAVAPATDPIASPTLSAWEMWLVNKAKDDRLKLEEKAVEEHLLKEKKEQEKREQEQKKLVVEEKIQEWLKTKREQEKLEKELKLSQEQEEIQRQKAKQRETEQRAQQKYKEWLRKKNQNKLEEEKREKRLCFPHRRRLPGERSRRRSAERWRRRASRNGWQVPTKKAELVPSHLPTQEVPMTKLTHRPASTTLSHGSQFTHTPQKRRRRIHLGRNRRARQNTDKAPALL